MLLSRFRYRVGVGSAQLARSNDDDHVRSEIGVEKPANLRSRKRLLRQRDIERDITDTRIWYAISSVGSRRVVFSPNDAN